MKYILIILLVLSLAFVSAEIGYNNRNLPRIESPIVPVTQINNNTLNVNSSNCWQGDCSGMRNIFNQTLNTTNNVQFRNISVRNISIVEWILGKSILLSNLGSATFPSTTFQVGTIDIGTGLLTLAIIRMTGGTGIEVGAIENGLYLIPSSNATKSQLALAKNPNADDVWFFQVNNESGVLDIVRTNPFTAILTPSTINATNTNITSNHQTYDITSTTAFDTTYQNNQSRPIYIDITLSNRVSASGDIATGTLYSNGSIRSIEGILNYPTTLFDGTQEEYHHLGGYVQPAQKWSINSTVGGSGSISLTKVVITVI